ncbi:hypothetical protein B0H16DRAFT_1365255 [Mycena metata]|uniref:MYND-type domain-containing protein n=1 Tax=Mycena metata TaxID=1033252 RepID=A0AAD7JUM8_9AGAR|nr:hypothetical protein B0H16DRAFT_1365255 [Mycena metata]
MDKRFGAEGKRGIAGGGLVSEESQRSLQLAEDLSRRGKHEESYAHLQIALKDPNNFDAYIQLALQVAPALSVQLLEVAEKRARDLLISRLGPDCFDDNGPCVGKFGDSGLLLTRPYMRVLDSLVRMCFYAEQYEKGVDTCIETLRLNPIDELYQRRWLPSLLIRTGRFADALFFCQVWMRHDTDRGSSSPIRGGTAFRAPDDKLLWPEVEKYATRAAVDMIYSAALAAFKLWGRSPLAAQLLRMAARKNPGVLANIMARRTRPTDGKRHSPLGDADIAHEYLWVAQDLWMAPEVWTWVNEDAAVSALILKSCARPECAAQETKATQFRRCSGCQQVEYCGVSCQKTDWKRHKTDCNQRAELRKMMKNLYKNKETPGMLVLQDGLDDWF